MVRKAKPRRKEQGYHWPCPSCRAGVIEELTALAYQFRVDGEVIYTSDRRAQDLMQPYIEHDHITH
jgi:hypothetical protein